MFIVEKNTILTDSIRSRLRENDFDWKYTIIDKKYTIIVIDR